MFKQYAREAQVAVSAVRLACRVTDRVFKSIAPTTTLIKPDHSPVTVADFSAQAIVNSCLESAFPTDGVVGEEDGGDLLTDDKLMTECLQLVNDTMQNKFTKEQLVQVINRGDSKGGPKGRFWALDPVDGTKGFLRGGQYAVCLALIEDGDVKVGVLGCPNWPKEFGWTADSSAGAILVAVKGQGAFKSTLDSENLIPVDGLTTTSESSEACFCESVEAGHSDQDKSSDIGKLLGITRPPIRMDSQCKYAALATGKADIYLRLAVKPGYVEKIWDHAAGDLIVREAGGLVTDADGKRLDFSRGRLLHDNSKIQSFLL